MISQKSKYALRALLMLAEAEENRPCRIPDIAETQQIPRKFLEQILLDLKAGGLVRSLRGKKGGYLLARPPESISVADAVRTIDGPIAPLPCVSRRFFHRCEGCRGDSDCAFRDAFDRAHAASLEVLEGTSLAAVRDGASPV